MPTLLRDLARVYDDASVRVDKLRLSSSCRLSDGAMNVTVYGNDLTYVFYMLRNMNKNTLHRIVGSVSVSAYISQNANRANYSARIGPDTIEPLTLRDQQAVINAELVGSGLVVNDKVAFITSLFILQNWERSFVRAVPGDKVGFALEVLRLQSALIERSLLPADMVACCTVETVEVTTTARLRPAQVTNEQTVVLNNEFAVINLVNYTLSNLCSPAHLELLE